MSNFAEIRQRTHEAAQPIADDFGCHADGCPCRGTIRVEGLRWTCSWHAFAKPSMWPQVTQKLREHDWLLNFISEVSRLDRVRPKGNGWREYATKFWEGVDDHCIPHEKEDCGPYLNRMRAEIAHRCGITSKCPDPRIPSPPITRWNAAKYLGEQA